MFGFLGPSWRITVLCIRLDVLYDVLKEDINLHLLDGSTEENKGKLILTEIFPSVQKHDIKSIIKDDTLKLQNDLKLKNNRK